MATTPIDLPALSQTVHEMKGTLGGLVKTVYWGFGLSFVALAGLAAVSASTKQDVGKVQGQIEAGTIGTDLKAIKDLLERPPAPAEKPPEKQGSLENLPQQMGNWTGIKAESTNDLANALTKVPTKGPVWLYTDDPAAAAAVENGLKAQ